MTAAPETSPSREAPTGRTSATRHVSGAPVVGGFFLVMGGVHLGLVASDTGVYRDFADHALFGFVRTGWGEVFMADPAVWALLLMAGELTLGTLLLVGGRARQVGWVGVIGFHLLLMLFGWWAWAWSIPALAVLVTLALRDRRYLRAGSAGVPGGAAAPR